MENERKMRKHEKDSSLRRLFFLFTLHSQLKSIHKSIMSIEEKIHNYVQNQKRLLELELRSEEDEVENQDDEERAGHILRNVRMDSISVGLVGKTVIHFVNGDLKSPILPAHRLSVGDEVEIIMKHGSESENKTRKSPSGAVICQVSDTTITLTMFDDTNSDDITFDGLVCLVPRSSVEVHKKLVKGLDELQKSGIDHVYCGKVIETIFHPPQDRQTADLSIHLEPFNKNLDESQTEAIKFSLFGAQPVTLIHGPPGTGKTTTVVELIKQAVEIQNFRVLVTAPSNQAVDNILEKLVIHCDANVRKKLRAVRLGHPARINPSILKYSLESLVRNSDGTEIVNDIRQELKSFLNLTSSPKTRGMERRAAYREIKTLRKEIREREEKVISSILGNAQIVLATNVGAATSMLDKYGKLPFDLVIVDEAAQALEASCWIPAMRGKRLILAGDHCQLPPTIKCKRSDVVKELSRTMFERVMEENKFASRMLQIQYRMHEDISNWSSMAMYDGRLQSHNSVRARKLSHLPSINNNDVEPDSILSITRDATLLLIDTAGADLFESVNAAGSRYNEGEASIVAKHVDNLIALGIKVEDIAVISPYNGQIEILKLLLLNKYPKLEIRSVDGFQGGEREAVVLSLVRSSDRGGKDGVGFLRDNRRLNVAVTRAKRQCAVICDIETVSQDNFLKGFVNWIEDHGEYLSAMDYSDYQEEKVHTVADIQLEHINCGVKLQTDTTVPEFQAEVNGSDLSSGKVPMEPTYDDAITQEKELDDQLSFFAEVADDENEILQLHVSRSETLLQYLRSLCGKLSLKPTLVRENEDIALFSFSKCLVQSTYFEKIKADLLLFANSAEIDEYYDFLMTPDINIFELKAICKELKLKYESHPGKFIVQIDRGDDASPSLLEDTVRSINKLSEDDGFTQYSEIDVSDDGSQAMASETPVEQSSGSIAEDDTTTEEIEINPIGDLKKLDATREGTNFQLNDLLGSLARERKSRINSSQKQERPSKIKQISTSKGKNQGKKLINKAANDEDLHDLDDMAFLDSQINKLMNSHGRKIEGKGKNFRTIINGNLLPKPRTEETKARDPRKADALARKLKEAKIARSAKTKKK